MAITSKPDHEKDGDKPAKVAPATGFAPSGAPEQTTDIDANHPAVDNNPREGTTADMNKVDFNEPSGLTPPEEAVAENLKK